MPSAKRVCPVVTELVSQFHLPTYGIVTTPLPRSKGATVVGSHEQAWRRWAAQAWWSSRWVVVVGSWVASAVDTAAATAAAISSVVRVPPRSGVRVAGSATTAVTAASIAAAAATQVVATATGRRASRAASRPSG